MRKRGRQLYGRRFLKPLLAFIIWIRRTRIPALILTQESLSDKANLEAMLSELACKTCKIQTRPRGVRAGWLDFALRNLDQSIAEHAASSATIAMRYQALANLLHLQEPIRRMECFDVSHTQGEATVASCVVFDASGPRRNEYRRFNISNITPGDDYAAMRQAIARRFKRLLKEQSLPDLLIIDGGKGQVAVAKEVLADLGIEGLSLLGIAKGPDRKAGWERLILVSENKEITLPADSKALHLLQHIRDEAHRFAISAHRKKRQHLSLDSSLETIEGIGPKRAASFATSFWWIARISQGPG